MAFGSKQSLSFLRSLEECELPSLFDVPVLQAYLGLKWRQARRVLLIEASFHSLLLLLFNLFSVVDSAESSFPLRVVLIALSGLFLAQ